MKGGMKMSINKAVLNPNGGTIKRIQAKEKADQDLQKQKAKKLAAKTKKKAKAKTLVGRLDASSFDEGEVLERNGYGGKTLRYINRYTVIKHLNEQFQHHYSLEIKSIEPLQPMGYAAVVRLTIDHPKLKRTIEEVGETDSSSMKSACSDATKRAASHVLPYYNELWREDV
jgi:hypothetical protein